MKPENITILELALWLQADWRIIAKIIILFNQELNQIMFIT